MGRCLVNGLVSSSTLKPANIFFTTGHSETTKAIQSELKITSCANNSELVKKCRIVVLAVKPQNMTAVLSEIAESLTPEHTIVSVVASVPTSLIEATIKKPVPVIRAMPNTPVFVGEGITAACLNNHCRDAQWDIARLLFEPVGQLVRVDEKHMNAVTGLSGCGPAYAYVILESLTEGGIKVGLNRELATQLASQTMLGAAKMLQATGRHPAALKDEVTTPAGCTIDGLLELEEGKLRVTLIKAVVQATKRAQTLASGKDDPSNQS